MSELVVELKTIYEEVQALVKSFDSPAFITPLEALERSATEAGKAWSHSWLGYQSRIYYQDLKIPPASARFSSEWGFKQLHIIPSTCGNWIAFSEGAVETEIKSRAGSPDTSQAEEISLKARNISQDKQADVVSILRIVKGGREDTFIDKLLEEAEHIKALDSFDFITHWKPSGRIMTRDMIALTQGLWTPPHLSVLADVAGMKSPKAACESLLSVVRRAFSHIERTEKKLSKAERIGTNVFIGHGRSKEWKDLKDFINDRMRLPWDEFNRVPVAGVANTMRLTSMLDNAAIAFLVLTAEDETADGKTHARMNVVHEVGLFQGRLGFTRAIVMLEEGCEAFSNIDGLGQIRFPKGDIRAAFHDVQLVLEREYLVESPNEEAVVRL